MEAFIYILISVLFSAFFSAMEVAFISSNKLRYEVDKKERSLSSPILGVFYRNPSRLVSTLWVGNSVALVVYGLQMAHLLRPLIESRVTGDDALIVLILSVISALLVLFVGEFLPQAVARLNPNLSLNLFSVPLFIIYLILYPISWFSSLLSAIVLRVAGMKASNAPSVLGKMDLDYFIQQRMEDAPVDSEMDTEVKMFQNALDFSNVRVKDCIVPRTEIVACDTMTTIAELRSRFIETGFSKILVFKDNIDDIIGYIHSSELFKAPEDWTTRIRSVSIVPETMAANKLMKQLLQEKKSLAVVVDEFGGTSGIVTLEDLVEEIFGEIEDEHDTKSYVARKVSENEFVLSGRIEIDTLNEKFGLELPESDEYVTIAGFILHFYQKFPKLNETVEVDKYTFKILKVTATKIELVRMKVEN